ncbi:MAG TPA: sugar phosphate nucleotidyltransferase [Kofleriaceae bacterium]|nr:sugar phosphate nucleotidyltransferase [Kofleriaceae bacterium]
MIDSACHPYVVVLAGGEGTRLAPLTRALYGHDLPKQFAVLAGEKSLLQQTIDRALVLTTADHVIVIVTGEREAVAREQLARYPGVELVVQPRNLDTGPGLLLPLVRILARAAHARVVFLPSDHYVADDQPLADAVRASAHGVLNERLSLIGVAPTGPEVEYGWIVRGHKLGRTRAYAVARFAEKPEAHVAEQLWCDGGLWNTFISAGPVRVFWELARQYLPRHTTAFERYAAAIGSLAEDAALAEAYHAMPSANFSRDVLSHARELAVIPVAGTGWSDWGSPKRVFASLLGTTHHDRLVARIRSAEPIALAG